MGGGESTQSPNAVEASEYERKNDHFARLVKSGSCAFRTVFRGRWKGKDVAVKKIEKADRPEARRLKELMKIRHPSLCSIFGGYEEDGYCFIVMEFWGGRTLNRYLVRTQWLVGKKEFFNWIQQIASGLEYLHSRNIMHGDLKTDNLIMNDKENLKICDFGLCREVGFHSVGMTRCKKPRYMAPELQLANSSRPLYSNKADVYSFGVIVWEMFIQKKPYHGASIESHEDLGRMKLKIPSTVPEKIADILNGCLDRDYHKRMSFTTVVELILLAQNSLRNVDKYEWYNLKEPWKGLSPAWEMSEEEMKMAKSRGHSITQNEDREFEEKEVSFAELEMFADKIGIGRFGTIQKGRWKKMDIAVKTVSRSEVRSEARNLEELKQLEHPNLCKIYGCYQDGSFLRIIMHFCNGMTLREILDGRKLLSKLRFFKWMTQIASGMEYLHSRELIHGNLGTDNIMIDHDEENVMIIGYGLYREFDHTTRMTLCGVQRYMAPEVILKRLFSKMADVYSYGVILWTALTQEVPYTEVDEWSLYSQVGSGLLKLKIPDDAPQPIADLLTQCLHRDCHQRKPFSEILEQIQEAQDASFDGLEELEDIGQGVFASVRRGKWKGKDVAVKAVVWFEDHFDTLEDKMDHPHLCKIYGSFHDGNLLRIVMSLCDGWFLREWFKREGLISKMQFLKWIGQIASGMEYLHSKKIMHRNVKPENVMADRLENAMIWGFGSWQKFEDMLKSFFGAPQYMAPEVMRNEPYLKMVDLYSFGVVAWESLTQEEPFRHISSNEVISQVGSVTLKLEIQALAPESISSLLDQCRRHDCDKRKLFPVLVALIRSAELSMEDISDDEWIELKKLWRKNETARVNTR